MFETLEEICLMIGTKTLIIDAEIAEIIDTLLEDDVECYRQRVVVSQEEVYELHPGGHHDAPPVGHVATGRLAQLVARVASHFVLYFLVDPTEYL